MRKGNNAQIVFDDDGEILLIATGSDYCAEHEQGSMDMQKKFCRPLSAIYSPMTGKETSMEGLLDELRQNQKFFDGYFSGKVQVKFPSLLERKKIRNNLHDIHFDQYKDDCGEDMAVVCANSNREHAYKTLSHFGKNVEYDTKKKKQIASPAVLGGAWDSESFAFAVKGEELIAKLARFFQKIQAGEALFAGTFMPDSTDKRLTGVIVMDGKRLKPEHSAEIEKAQAEFENNILLNANDATRRVNQANIQKRGLGYSHVWNVWHPDEVQPYHPDFLERCKAQGRTPKVLCAINPDGSLRGKVMYGGPYTPEDLIALATGEKLEISRVESMPKVVGEAG